MTLYVFEDTFSRQTFLIRFAIPCPAQLEIQLTDPLSKLNDFCAVIFEGKTFNIVNSLDWLKASIEFRLDFEDRDELAEYVRTFIYGFTFEIAVLKD